MKKFMDKLRIGLIGLGTVGSGVYKSLKSFENIEIVKIVIKDIMSNALNIFHQEYNTIFFLKFYPLHCVFLIFTNFNFCNKKKHNFKK